MDRPLRLIYCVFGLVTFCQASIIPCKDDDTKCLVSTANDIYPKIMAGDASIGAEILDPVWIDEIDGSVTILKYKFERCTVAGYKKCNITSLRIDTHNTKLKLNLMCPEVNLSGYYDINGRLIILPVQGNGNFSIDAYSYNINIDATYKIVKTDDRKEYITIKNFNFDANAEKGAKFQFDNLFNGRKDLADSVLKFANENSKEVLQEFQRPILSITYKIFMKNINKFLKAMPMDNIFKQ